MINQTVLSLSWVRSCGKRARVYMILYEAFEAINLEDYVGIGDKIVLNKHTVLEDSIQLYFRLQWIKNTHRSIMDKQLYNVRLVQRENLLDVIKDSKKQLVLCLLGKMIKL